MSESGETRGGVYDIYTPTSGEPLAAKNLGLQQECYCEGGLWERKVYDMENQGDESAILLDVENILFAALRDAELEPSINQTARLRALITVLERLASSFGKVTERFAAIAIPPNPRMTGNTAESFSRIYQLKQKAERTSIALVEWGYDTLHVRHRKNAADEGLCRLGRTLVLNKRIRSVVLATMDGEEPFGSLIDFFLKSGIQVHVACYNSIPMNVRARGDITASLVAPEIRHLLSPDNKSVTLANPPPLEEGRPKDSLPFSEASEQLRSDIRILTRNADAEVRACNRMWVAATVKILVHLIGPNERHDLPYFTRCVWNKVDSWPDPKPTNNEVQIIVAGLKRFSDLFFQKNTLSINRSSKFVEALMDHP